MDNLFILFIIIAILILAAFLILLWLRVGSKPTEVTSQGTDQLHIEIVSAFKFKGVSPAIADRIRDAINKMGGTGIHAEEQYQASLSALQPYSTAVVTAVGDELKDMPTDKYLDRWSLIQLLAELQNPDSLTLLDSLLSKPLAVERFKDPHKRSSLREETINLTTAVEAVSRIAENTNSEALDLLLKHAGHASLSVRRACVQGYLTWFGEGAREKLLKVLPKNDHYLLEVRQTNIEKISPIRVSEADIPFRIKKETPNDKPSVVPDRHN